MMLTTDIAEYLDSISLVVFTPSDIATNNVFINNQPEKPNNIISIYDTGGEGSIIGLSDTRRTIQIIIRHANPIDGNLRAWEIHNALTDTSRNGFLSYNGRNMLIRSRNTPSSIGKDENGLYEWSINFDIWTQND